MGRETTIHDMSKIYFMKIQEEEMNKFIYFVLRLKWKTR